MISSIHSILRDLGKTQMITKDQILQPVSGNTGRKLKGKAETHHSAKEWSTNQTALKLFVQQGAEKSQLEEWKADLLRNLTSKIA